MVQSRVPTLAPAERMNRRERAERILDAAADLLLRHGYNRITLDRFLTDAEQLPLEVKAEALALTVRRAFEPEELPAGAASQNAASEVIEWLEQLCALSEQQLREQMEPRF